MVGWNLIRVGGQGAAIDGSNTVARANWRSTIREDELGFEDTYMIAIDKKDWRLLPGARSA